MAGPSVLPQITPSNGGVPLRHVPHFIYHMIALQRDNARNKRKICRPQPSLSLSNRVE